MQTNLPKVIFFLLLNIAMPGIVKSKCSSTMGKQVVHCTDEISSIKELNEEINSTTSVIVLKDLEGLKIEQDDHISPKFNTVTAYQLSRIKHLELSQNSFVGLSNLLILKLIDNVVNNLNNNVFRGLHSLELLELVNCGINHIDEKAFDGLTNLRSLDLTNNNIKTISKRHFQHVPNLNSLALYKNEINTLDADCFKYLTELTTLGLSENNLKTINAETFNTIPKLIYLYISFNEIDNILGDFKCVNLKFISLNYNKLRNISRNLFKACKSLVDVDLAFNNLDFIDEYAFDNLPKLMNLHLRNCSVDVSGLKFVNKPLIVM